MLIFVVFIVGIVLWQLGIFNLETVGANTSTGFTGAEIGILDASIKCDADSDNATFFITNQAGAALTNIIVAPITDDVCTNPDHVSGEGYELLPGRKHLITLTGCDFTPDEKADFGIGITFQEKVAGEEVTKVINGRIICIGE